MFEEKKVKKIKKIFAVILLSYTLIKLLVICNSKKNISLINSVCKYYKDQLTNYVDTLYRWQQTTCSIWLTFFFFFYGNLANRRNLTELISIVRDRQWSVAKNNDVAPVSQMPWLHISQDMRFEKLTWMILMIKVITHFSS